MGNVLRAYSLAFARLLPFATSLGLGSLAAHADTLEWALVQAYQNNPSLNAQRASLRATDENVPQALSGYRPKLSLTAAGGYNYQNATSVFPLGGALVTSPFAQNFYSRTIGANGTYTLFNGFQTANRTRQAESQVDAARETLRVTEQQVLLDAATAYMNSVARSGGARSAAAQRRSSDRAAQTDARSLQRRRSDAHRRGAGRIRGSPPDARNFSPPSRNT